MPDYAHRVDGCSGLMSWTWWTIAGHGPPWEGCCNTHDDAYGPGGTAAQRRLADRRLRDCVAANGHPAWAWVMWALVRVGGVPGLPTRWRWGYNWRFRWFGSYEYLVRRLQQEETNDSQGR
jgi:hypothetical protein